MLVKNWMSKDIITVDVEDSMHDAMKLLKENQRRVVNMVLISRSGVALVPLIWLYSPANWQPWCVLVYRWMKPHQRLLVRAKNRV